MRCPLAFRLNQRARQCRNEDFHLTASVDDHNPDRQRARGERLPGEDMLIRLMHAQCLNPKHAFYRYERRTAPQTFALFNADCLRLRRS